MRIIAKLSVFCLAVLLVSSLSFAAETGRFGGMFSENNDANYDEMNKGYASPEARGSSPNTMNALPSTGQVDWKSIKKQLGHGHVGRQKDKSLYMD